MKRRIKRLVAMALTAVLATGAMPLSGSVAKAEESQLSFLKASGKNVRDNYGNGEVVNLRGTNAGGYLLQEFWMTPTGDSKNVHAQNDILKVLTERFGQEKAYELIDAYEAAYWTEDDFANCKAMGMNCIRLPFWWRNLTDENGNFYGYDENAADPYAKAFERMDWFVETAAKYDLYVIIDFHGAPGSQNGSDHSGVDGQSAKEAASEFFFGPNAAGNQELFYSIWEVIASRYAGNPAVAGYDLLNEPFCTYRYDSAKSEDVLHSMLWGIYDKAYDVIKAVDSDHIVIMEAVWDPGDLPDPETYGWENIMYEYHNYLYDDYDNAAGQQISNMQSKINSIGNKDYDVPSYLGEFSYFNNVDAWDQGLEYLVNSGINWTTWTYKTIDNFGNWGLYHHDPVYDEGINIEKADYDEIMDCWTRVGTAEGTANTALIEKATKWFNADTVENKMGPAYADLENGIYYFTGRNSKKVLRVADDSAKLGVIGKKISEVDEEKFEIIHNDDNTVSIKSVANGKYVSVNEDDSKLYATADEITPAEKFYMLKQTDTEVAFKSVTKKLFACADENLSDFSDGYPLIVDRSSASNWESYKVTNLDLTVWGAKDSDGEEEAKATSGFVRLEGEGAELFDGADTEEQDFYSGKNAVAKASRDEIKAEDAAANLTGVPRAKFTVNAVADGDYRIRVAYNGDDDKKAVIAVNGVGQVVDVPAVRGDHAWNEMHSIYKTVALNKGENTIEITGALGGGWLNIDYLEVAKAPITFVDEEKTIERYEAEDFDCKSANSPSAEHQNFYSGIANANGVGGIGATDRAFEVGDNVLESDLNYVDYTIYADKAGSYDITIAGNGNGADMTCVYQLEGSKSAAYMLNNAGFGWDHMVYATVNVELKEGYNSFILAGTFNGDWLNIDYIDVKAVAAEGDSDDGDGNGEVIENPDEDDNDDVVDTIPTTPLKPAVNQAVVKVVKAVATVVTTVVKVVSKVIKGIFGFLK